MSVQILTNKKLVKKYFLYLVVLTFIMYMSLRTYYNTMFEETTTKIEADRLKTAEQIHYKPVKYHKHNPHKIPIEKKANMKYMLQWTSPDTVPFVYMGHGQQGFIDRNCSFTNCYVTADRNYLKDLTEFDVVVFAGPQLNRAFNAKPMAFKRLELPKKRSPLQKYVFASIESAENYPICSEELDGYFNWTWTYRLDSDARWGYFDIKDSTGKIVGPKKEMTWIKPQDMQPVSENLKKILRGKTKAVAWFVSNCNVQRRTMFANHLVEQLHTYGLTLDVYGECGSLACKRSTGKQCDEMIERDYYFYLCFENALSEDYLTEKLLHAVNYNTIPVVLSGANLTRFLPEGSYLDANALGARKLAAKMNELIKDSEKYAEYFKWRNHYSYHRQSESPDTDEYCSFCALSNNEELVKQVTVYNNFKQWWTPHHVC